MTARDGGDDEREGSVAISYANDCAPAVAELIERLAGALCQKLEDGRYVLRLALQISVEP